MNVIASMIFSGMSGAAVADAAGLGLIELKAMEDHGYDNVSDFGRNSSSFLYKEYIFSRFLQKVC